MRDQPSGARPLSASLREIASCAFAAACLEAVLMVFAFGAEWLSVWIDGGEFDGLSPWWAWVVGVFLFLWGLALLVFYPVVDALDDGDDQGGGGWPPAPPVGSPGLYVRESAEVRAERRRREVAR